ncbi:unnamed protein product, partial [Chrysoparadoxa australica]
PTQPAPSKTVKKKESLPLKKPETIIKRSANPVGKSSSVRQPHEALTDDQGNIYPENITVDGEHLVAYGDLIVGEARYIDEYRNGERPLYVPTPRLWPKGDIPFYVQAGISLEQVKIIKTIAKDLKEKVGVNLHPIDSPNGAYLRIVPGENNCYATVGYSDDVSTMSLSPGCKYGDIYHEVFHVLGFFHEQNRFDRDDYLKILWENIDEKFWNQFEKFSERSFPPAIQEIPFSFKSFMLYDPKSFSISEDYTMVNLYGEPYSVFSSSPTEVDYERLKNLYHDELSF